MYWIIALVAALLLLVTCHNDDRSRKAAEESRIEKEVKSRVDTEVKRKTLAVDKETYERRAELRTIRVIGFIALAGGSLGGLIWLQRNRSYVPPQTEERNLQMPTWLDHFNVPDTRVLDLHPPAQPAPSAPIPSPAPQDAWTNINTPPRRHRASRRNRRNRNQKNQDHDETPRDR